MGKPVGQQLARTLVAPSRVAPRCFLLISDHPVISYEREMSSAPVLTDVLAGEQWFVLTKRIPRRRDMREIYRIHTSRKLVRLRSRPGVRGVYHRARARVTRWLR